MDDVSKCRDLLVMSNLLTFCLRKDDRVFFLSLEFQISPNPGNDVNATFGRKIPTNFGKKVPFFFQSIVGRETYYKEVKVF